MTRGSWTLLAVIAHPVSSPLAEHPRWYGSIVSGACRLLQLGAQLMKRSLAIWTPECFLKWWILKLGPSLYPALCRSRAPSCSQVRGLVFAISLYLHAEVHLFHIEVCRLSGLVAATTTETAEAMREPWHVRTSKFASRATPAGLEST